MGISAISIRQKSLGRGIKSLGDGVKTSAGSEGNSGIGGVRVTVGTIVSISLRLSISRSLAQVVTIVSMGISAISIGQKSLGGGIKSLGDGVKTSAGSEGNSGIGGVRVTVGTIVSISLR